MSSQLPDEQRIVLSSRHKVTPKWVKIRRVGQFFNSNYKVLNIGEILYHNSGLKYWKLVSINSNSISKG